MHGPVYIQRDANGVAHIFAQTDANDAYLALGYIHAQDRFWQMEFQRRIAAGRLSEIFGNKTIKEDKFLRTWGFYRATQAEWPYLNAETRQVIQSYTAGVNAFIAECNFPLQIKLLRYTPESWSIYDSMSWQKMMAFSLQSSWVDKLDNLMLVESQGESKLLEYMPAYPSKAPTILTAADLTQTHAEVKSANSLNSKAQNSKPELSSLERQQIAALIQADQNIITNLGFEQFSGKGSNSWVVSGKMTQSGRPILANDTHLKLSAPSLWYLAELSGPGLEVTGATIPGLPGVVIGHNQHIAWGLTAAYNDAQDLFKIESHTPTQSLIETIYNKESEPLELKIAISKHGPIISPVIPEIESLHLAYRLAIQWPVLESADTTIQSMLEVQKAENWPEFVAALRDFVGPSQNFIYADTAGNIGYYLPGKLPLRVKFNGQFPLSESLNWSGYIPFSELPQSFNPPEGFIVTANNKIVPDSYQYLLANRWDTPPYRAERIRDLITTHGRLNRQDMEQFQQDSQSYLWHDLAPVLLKTKALDSDSKLALQILKSWDGNFSLDSQGATIFAYWLQQFKTLVPYQSIFGKRALPSYQYLIATLSHKEKAGYLSSSLATALKQLKYDQGSDIKNWQWGLIHMAYFSEMGLGQAAIIGWLWERKVATPGGYDTINVGSYNAQTFQQRFGATYRQVIDLADIDHSQFIYPLGQSENVNSKNYANLLQRWSSGKYISIPAQPKPCNPTQALCLVLLPAKLAN